MDHDPSNNALSNLVFLCLPHHDLYDSTTSQSKNITKGEVSAFRDELKAALDSAFSNETRFGEATTSTRHKVEAVEGHYIRTTDGDGSYQSAEIKISRVVSRHSQYHVSGFALWGKKRPNGPNTGEFDYILEFDGKSFHHLSSSTLNSSHSITIKVSKGKLVVTEENWLGVYGMNVNFIGDYIKTG